jgi:endoglycosylceramidase
VVRPPDYAAAVSRPNLIRGVALAALLVLVAGCSGSTPSTTPSPSSTAAPGSTAAPTTTAPAALPAIELSPLHVVKGERPHFEDAKGREVLLRGVNVNSFGDYFQGDPALPSTVPVTGKDWDSMAALGFSAVRFIVSWSALEPEKGTYDEAYIAKVKAGVAEAGKRGIYVVLDMHQDAWGKYVATPAGTTCEEGAEPAIGWDGAPQWATATDPDPGASCRAKGARELSRIVGASFTAFYNDKDGLRTSLANAWGHLAGAVATEPAVVGYDLFNEPNPSGDAALTLTQYTTYLNDSIAAIRTGEQKAGAQPRIAFVEPIVTWPLPNTAPAVGSITDPNIAFAPHNYFGSISKLLTAEQGFAANTNYAKQLGAAVWTGEYGWWSDDADNMAKLRGFAVAEDKAIASGAWWQWRQACGDPHSIDNPERKTSDQLHLNGVGCPGDKDKGVTKAYATVLSRAYPRAAPGLVTTLVSDPDARTMVLAGTAATSSGGALVVWVPDAGKGAPKPTGVGVKDLKVEAVTGGFYVTGTTDCAYQLSIDGADVAAAPLVAC